MSFQTGLSGLNASSKSLDVIGNNIANANTVGMKSSRAEFADLVASQLGTGGGAGAGIGVAVATVAQQFTQGNISSTGNSMDVAINGGGFFGITKTDGTPGYTRDGQFKLDKDGYILTNTGANVMGFTTDINGVANSAIPNVKLQVPAGAPIAASPTTTITAGLNLDSTAVIASSVTPATPRATYGTSVTTFDSQGNELPLSLYFTRIDPNAGYGASTAPVESPLGPTVPATDQWAMYDSLTSTTPVGYITFDSAGKLSNVYGPPATVPPAQNSEVLANKSAFALTVANPTHPTAGSITPSVDFSAVTQFGTDFSVTNLSQNGYTSGEFTGLNIDPKGVITTRYSNGQTLKTGGMIALADFRNLQGLEPIGNGEFVETFKSGSVVWGKPTIGRFGELRAGAVEESNVELTAELVNMMTAQRNYQANAQTIKTQDQIMSTLVNLR
jgi:flagellar hook protein FlgE